MKEILIISPGYLPIINNDGGAIESLLKLYFSHNEKTSKYKITVYSVKNKNDIPDSNLAFKNIHFRVIDLSNTEDNLHKFSRLSNIIFGTPCARLYIKKILQDLKNKQELNHYDLIIIENCVNDLAYIGKHLKTNTPIVLHLHNDYLGKERPDAKKATGFLTQVWCVSNYLRDRVNKIDPKVNKAITIYNAINMDNFKKKLSEKEKENIRDQLGFKKDDFVFIYAGRIMKIKGVLPLVKSFNKFSAGKDDIKLLIIGDKKSPNSKDVYYNKFLRIIKHNSKIKYLGRIENENLYKYYQISNCQIIPSKCQEAFGLVALEGKASNLRIISTGSGGLREVLGKNDIMINNLKSKTLISAMNCAIKSSSNNNVESQNNFSKEKFTSEIDRQIDSCINARLKNAKKTVLHVFYSLNNGGTEKYLINLLRCTNSDYHNLVLKYGGANYWEKELADMDVKVFESGKKNIAKMKKIYEIIKDNNVDIVYSYTHLNSIFVLFPAWLAGVKKRITHSHISNTDKKKCFVKNFTSRVGIELFSTERLACSDGAGKFLFLRKNFKTVRNGIDINEYIFDEASRKSIRKKLGINPKTLVIGTVGRIDQNKNQKFMLDILFECIKRNIDARLLVVGDGPERQNLEKYAQELKIIDNVIFVGNVMDVKKYYDAMDVFLLTSLNEGLPFVLIEAQANGLPILASDSIDKNAKINSNFYFLSLDSGLLWAKKIMKIMKNRCCPDDTITRYSVEKMSSDIKDIYESERSNEKN